MARYDQVALGGRLNALFVNLPLVKAVNESRKRNQASNKIKFNFLSYYI
jgi:hypothetical protein